MAAQGILIGSRALAEYAKPIRPVADLDVILHPIGLARLTSPVVATGVPGRFLSDGMDITLYGSKPAHAILSQLLVGTVEIRGLILGLPSLSALWAIKSGAMAYAPRRAKTQTDLAHLEALGAPSVEPLVLALEAAIRSDAASRL
ncbi:hypothetical protein D3C72_680560 [compost metagenome]